MKLLCFYCDRTKCDCGGTRRVISHPKNSDVEIQCDRCKARWLHYHKQVSKNKIRGTARIPV